MEIPRKFRSMEKKIKNELRNCLPVYKMLLFLEKWVTKLCYSELQVSWSHFQNMQSHIKSMIKNGKKIVNTVWKNE